MTTRKLYVGDEVRLNARPTMPAQTAWITMVFTRADGTQGEDYMVRRSDGIREMVSYQEFSCLRALPGVTFTRTSG